MDIVYWLGLDNTPAFSLLISDQITDSLILVKLQIEAAICCGNIIILSGVEGILVVRYHPGTYLAACYIVTDSFGKLKYATVL